MSSIRSCVMSALVLAAFGLCFPQSAFSLGLKSGGGISIGGSVISCTYGPSQGDVTAFPGDSTTDATFTESSSNLICTAYPDANHDGIPDCDITSADCPVQPYPTGHFSFTVQYTLVGGGLCYYEDANSGVGQEYKLCGTKFDQQNKVKGGGTISAVAGASCDDPNGVLTYHASCGSNVTVVGTLRWIGGGTSPTEPPPGWTGCGTNDTPDQCYLILGGFETDKKNNVDLTKCATDFPDQTTVGGTLGLGAVLLYSEKYVPYTACKGEIKAASGQRRMCDNNSFTDHTPNPCAPSGTGSNTIAHTAGVNPKDATTVDTVVLADNQWRPNNTLNLGCTNSGNIPTTIMDSVGFSTASIDDSPVGDVKAYVKGFPDDKSPAANVSTIYDANGNPIGKNYGFNRCNFAPQPLNGLDQVICRHYDQAVQNGYVDLTIAGTIAGTANPALGFTGDAIKVQVVPGSCQAGTY